jgi:hypothetical protein
MSETRTYNEREAKALPAFERWRDFLGLHEYGYGVPAFQRLKEAMYAVRGWRYASNTRGGDYETATLAVRVCADTFASQIAAAATPECDEHTIRWVVAGLRCPSAPFCTGCPACQTVTAPERPNVRRRALLP